MIASGMISKKEKYHVHHAALGDHVYPVTFLTLCNYTYIARE